jgi:hypothetical protein
MFTMYRSVRTGLNERHLGNEILIAKTMDGASRVSYNDLSYLKKRFGVTSELIEIVPGIEKIAGIVTGQNPTR